MAVKNWIIDPAHTEVMFKVKHMMFANVSGEFRTFEGGVDFQDENFENAKVYFKADPASISTNSPDRDDHLRSADFFDVENHKELTFHSTSIKQVDGNQYKVTGDMTIKGVTQPITLDCEFGGMMKDPWGNMKSGYSLSGKLNRKDFGLNWNAALEAGGVLVSDEVRLSCEIELAEKK